MTKKSTFGTINMDKKALKAVDICRIIDKCIQRQVAVLKFGDLYLKFQPSGQIAEEAKIHGNESTLQQSKSTLSERDDAQGSLFDRFKDEATLFDRDAAEDAALSQLLIEDPAAYEKLQMLDDLESSRVMNEKI